MTVIAMDYDEDYWQQLEESTNDPDYGETWIYMPDGDGMPRVALLTPPPPSDQSRIGNSDKVNFYLYTRYFDCRFWQNHTQMFRIRIIIMR